MLAFASVLLYKKGKVLLMRRSNTGFHDGKYVFPGGKVEKGETLLQTGIRETKEEVGVSTRDLKLIHVIHINEGNEVLVGFIFRARTWEGEPKNIEPCQCDEVAWYSKDMLPARTAPFVVQAIEHIQNGSIYSELHWDK